MAKACSPLCRSKGEGWEREGESWEGEDWEREGERGEGGGAYLGQEPTLQEFMPHQMDSNTPPPPGQNDCSASSVQAFKL